MTEKGSRELRRLDDSESKLPSVYAHLTEDEKRDVEKKLVDQDLRLREEFMRKKGQSNIAEHDLAVTLDAAERLSREGKMISLKDHGETGSGTRQIEIKGGDTKFIIPILVVIGLIILGLAFVFFHR
jgi:hypothetical protein